MKETIKIFYLETRLGAVYLVLEVQSSLDFANFLQSSCLGRVLTNCLFDCRCHAADPVTLLRDLSRSFGLLNIYVFVGDPVKVPSVICKVASSLLQFCFDHLHYSRNLFNYTYQNTNSVD